MGAVVVKEDPVRYMGESRSGIFHLGIFTCDAAKKVMKLVPPGNHCELLENGANHGSKADTVVIVS